MPSLEIICIGQPKPSDFSRLPFRVDVEKELISHRHPTPIFQDDFDKLEGYIYHLLDKGGVTAYDLLKRNWYNGENSSGDFNYSIEFKDEYALFVKSLLGQLLLSSSVGQVLFTTDYQFGPEIIEKYGPMPLLKFWCLHDTGQIRMNASYLITAS